MKRKLIAVLLAGLMALSSGACGSNSEDKKGQNKTETVKVPEKKEVYFKDDVLKIENATIKITNVEIIPPDTELGETNPSIAITYEFTNTSAELMKPFDPWLACFRATQELESTVVELYSGSLPDNETYNALRDMAYTDVKPGATVQAVECYEIKDTTRPVTLTARQGAGGKELGTKVIELQ